MYWYLKEKWGIPYADYYLKSDLINHVKIESYKSTIENIIKRANLTKNLWDTKGDSKWHYDSIKNLSIKEEDKQEIMADMDEANIYLNILQALTDKGIEVNHKNNKYSVELAGSYYYFDTLYDAQMFDGAKNDLIDIYKELYELKRDFIIKEIIQKYKEHYELIKSTKAYKEFISTYDWDEEYTKLVNSPPSRAFFYTFDVEKYFSFIDPNEEFPLLFFLYSGDKYGYGPKFANEYYFFIQEIINERAADKKVDNLINNLEYVDLLEYKDKFPLIFVSDEFKEYASTHEAIDIPGHNSINKGFLMSRLPREDEKKNIIDKIKRGEEDDIKGRTNNK